MNDGVCLCLDHPACGSHNVRSPPFLELMQMIFFARNCLAVLPVPYNSSDFKKSERFSHLEAHLCQWRDYLTQDSAVQK